MIRPLLFRAGQELPPGTVLSPGPYRIGLEFCCGLNAERDKLVTDDERPAVEVLEGGMLRCHACQKVSPAARVD